MQCKYNWHALGFRNQNPRHGETSPLLGKSTPPQGVNGLVSLWLATFSWTKSLLCNDGFK
jgi:hypothetical protein